MVSMKEIRNKVMEKIFKILLILCCAFCTIPAFACSSDKAETVVGAACSISELNNLEKERTEKGKMSSTTAGDINLDSERDLRPVKINTGTLVTPNGACIFGACLSKSLFDK